MIDRRAFLLGLGAAAAHQIATPRRAEAFMPHAPDIWTLQRRPSPLVVRGGELARLTRTGIEWWDTLSMTQVDFSPGGDFGICGLSDGTVVAVHARGLRVFDRSRAFTDVPIAALAGGGVAHLLRAVSPAEVNVELSSTVRRYRVSDGSEVGRFAIVGRFADQAAGLGDGRLVEPRGETLRVFEANGDVTVKYTPLRELIHVAAAEDGHVWTSILTGKWTSQVTLESVDAAGDALVDPKIWLFEGRVIHLSSSPGGAVALVMHATGWRMIVLDDAGTERWRAEVPPYKKSTNLGEPIYNLGFVALSAHSAVLMAEDAVLAWDAATGAPIAVTNP